MIGHVTATPNQITSPCSRLVTLAADFGVNGGLRREVDGQDKPDENT
jgi:hypothetical protein